MSPRPARFTRAQAVAAAADIIDEGGVEALTMRRLSSTLGVDPMALYRHFADKGDVVDAVADGFWMQCELPSLEDDDDWRGYAARVMREIRSELARHPNLIPVVATRPIASPGALAWADSALGRIIAAGAPVRASLGDLVNTLVMLTVASALGEYTPPAGRDAAIAAGAGRRPADQTAPGERAETPHLEMLARAGWAPDPARQFELALRVVLAGWAWD
ncbi:TetR/AcrR family transcriptional regulator [Microbacterium arborescens]|uniref:TetR/AcrR family transcriptional regulator n=1 Tax=Microbacterium arborescens TaxID=33883 RepID=UPI002780D714|nr:TetR/AcrR family transcriptional regulator [Microbacterium arborescens]MDQ1216670.1 TetR/AcrR family tetracycline transcriptional repressor [Microbacterium arborescens]